MKTFRFYLDIDAKDLDDAKNKLIDMSGGMSFGDLDNTELESIQTGNKELIKYLKIDSKGDNMFNKVEPLFSGFDGWACNVCGDTVGCDTKDMFRHLQIHTISELKESKEDNQ